VCGSRVRNRKVSAKTGKDVDDADIEMGFETGKGRYVTFSKRELDPRETTRTPRSAAFPILGC
jgi:non-homologous end joining protein Ku